MKTKIKDIDKAKRTFVKWLKKNNCNNLDEYEGDLNIGMYLYYRHISAFLNNDFYSVYFMLFGDGVNAIIKIQYIDEYNNYTFENIEDFLTLIK